MRTNIGKIRRVLRSAERMLGIVEGAATATAGATTTITGTGVVAEEASATRCCARSCAASGRVNLPIEHHLGATLPLAASSALLQPPSDPVTESPSNSLSFPDSLSTLASSSAAFLRCRQYRKTHEPKVSYPV